MRSFWKVFVALALMLPLGAFVAGTLVASAADDPTPRNTIIIDDQSGTSTPSQSATHDQGDDHGDHGEDGDDLTEVTPTPDPWGDDDHGDDHSDDNGDDAHGNRAGAGDRRADRRQRERPRPAEVDADAA